MISLWLSFFSILRVLGFELRSLLEVVVSSHSQAIMPFYDLVFFFNSIINKQTKKNSFFFSFYKCFFFCLFGFVQNFRLSEYFVWIILWNSNCKFYFLFTKLYGKYFQLLEIKQVLKGEYETFSAMPCPIINSANQKILIRHVISTWDCKIYIHACGLWNNNRPSWHPLKNHNICYLWLISYIWENSNL